MAQLVPIRKSILEAAIRVVTTLLATEAPHAAELAPTAPQRVSGAAVAAAVVQQCIALFPQCHLQWDCKIGRAHV